MNPNAQPNTMPGATAQDGDNLYNVGPPSVTKEKPVKQAYLPTNEYAWTYYEAQKQARLFFLPFNEYERIAANKIRNDLPPNMPKVNDGSLAALLNETPMRILAQPFSGSALVDESIDPQTGQPAPPQPWLSELINVLWEQEIVPYANMEAPFFQKQVLALYRALVYGSCPIYNFFTNRNGRRGVDFVLPYIRDVYLEVGKHSDLDSDYIFMDQYYTRLQLDKILAAGNRVEATGIKSPWNLKSLKQIRDSHVESQKEYLAKNPAERNRPVRSTQIRFTTVFQRGVNAPFDTFYAEGNKEDVVIVKSKVNEDPTGDLPIHFLYAYTDLFNPYGKGQIELSGGTQNVLDYMTQIHILANQVGLQPPILIEGDRTSTDLDSMIYAPSQFWFAGNAKVDVMETSSSVLKEFPQAYGLYKNQLINMQGTSTTDVMNEPEDPSKGKTPAAINTQNDRQNSHDNFLEVQTRETFSRVFKSMLNIHFANMQGKQLFKLAESDAVRLMRSGLIPPDPKNPTVPSLQEIEVDWDHLRGKFDFEIDPESSRAKNNIQQVEKLSEILDFVQKNPYSLQYIRSTGYNLNLGEVYNQIFTKLQIQGVEKILEPLSPQEKAQSALIPPMVFDKPSIQMHYPDIPAVAQQQLLSRLGLQVSLMDVLMGPVLDPNIRGVFQPEPETGPINEPRGQMDQPGQPPLPPASPSDVLIPKGSSIEPNPIGGQPAAPGQPPAAPPGPGGIPTVGQMNKQGAGNLDPKTIALVKQVMAEKQVPPSVAIGIIHARAMGLPEDEITKWLNNNLKGAKNGKSAKAKPKAAANSNN